MFLKVLFTLCAVRSLISCLYQQLVHLLFVIYKIENMGCRLGQQDQGNIIYLSTLYKKVTVQTQLYRYNTCQEGELFPLSWLLVYYY